MQLMQIYRINVIAHCHNKMLSSIDVKLSFFNLGLNCKNMLRHRSTLSSNIAKKRLKSVTYIRASALSVELINRCTSYPMYTLSVVLYIHCYRNPLYSVSVVHVIRDTSYPLSSISVVLVIRHK
jgi:hypothetical protein